ncbi:DOCK family protein [Cavenderia fasciculata]|uniref:DOCK family protein n=1 Tax=Cavenderia fasciculata TaxID=261658 RepID=F4Q9T6_CACFS|nr:DOCK family protein [Cavenderia fasciculata]EGG15455.1 DOCK family protein [Cavenderia fasciculata]|eukprot:XP_004354197.1 DOCK family protein [Cavenderia fasciculata]
MSTPISSSTSTSSSGINGKQSTSSNSLNGSGAKQQQQQQPLGASTTPQSAPLSVISVSSSPKPTNNSNSNSNSNPPTPSSPMPGNVATPNHHAHGAISDDSGSGIPANAKTNRLRVDYKFDEYEDHFFAKAIINDPLKISLIPDLLTIHSEKRQTKIIGSNIPIDLVPTNLPTGIQDSLKVFSQEWTVINREAFPTPSSGVIPLKPLQVQSYECDDEYEAGTPADAVKECNRELIDHSQTSLPDPKILDAVKNNRLPLFQTYFADELQPIEPPKIPRPLTENPSFQFQVECNEFKTLIGDIEPFFGRMFLFDANAEESKNQVISEIFHFDFNNHLDLLPKSTDIEQACRVKKAIFSVNRPSTHVYLIICIDKVMRGDPEETTKIYLTNPGKPKEIQKFQQEVRESIPKMGTFKQPFVWGYLELFDQNNQFLYNTPDVAVKVQNLTRTKGDLYNFVTKPEKKQNNWCECSIKVSSGEQLKTGAQDTRIDYLLRPVYYPIPSDQTPMSREIMTFDNPSEPNMDMGISYSNVLYFYPKSVNLNNFKSDKGSSARNIFLEVKLLEDDTNVNNSGLRSIYGQSSQPLLTRRFYSTVGYHNRKPKFSDEIKINLPANLTPAHHILVTFYHLGCRQSKKGDKPEVCLGHTAIRLFENDQIIVDGKYKKPMATVFPPKYLDMEAKEQTNSKMWVDNKKPVFAFRTRTISTLYPQDPILSYILREGADSDQNQLIEYLKKIGDVPNMLKLNFFPSLSRVLFKCIASLSKELQKNAFIALLTLVDAISRELKQDDRLLSYCNYIFNNSSSSNQLYEALVQTWISILETKDDKICVLSLQYSWFLFNITRKSMIIDIDIKGLIKNGRNRTSRVSEEFAGKFKYLFELLLIQLKQVYNVKLMIAKSFIVHVSYFIVDLLDVMNRGFIFRLIYSYVTGLDSSNTVMELTELKFTFLRVLASSESFIALNLPSTFVFPDILDIHTHYYKKHVLVGLLLQEVSNIIGANEKEMRLKAILTLREIMSRYDQSDHYNTPVIRERIAALYFPYVMIVVENFDALYKFDQAELKNWLICFIYVVKNLINGTVITDWWKKETQKSKISTFFAILSTSLTLFEYGNDSGPDSAVSNSISASTGSGETGSTTDSPSKGSRKNNKDDQNNKDGKVSIFKKVKGNGGQQINRETAKVLLEQYTNNLSKSDRTYSVSQTSSPVSMPSISTSLNNVPPPLTSHASSMSSSSTSSTASSSNNPNNGFRSFHKSIHLLTSTMEPAVTAEIHSIMHGNLTHEVSMTVLNCLVVYIKENKEPLRSQQHNQADVNSGKFSVSLERIFKIVIQLIKKQQSHTFLRLCFLVLASMSNEFKIALFRNQNTICSELTPEIFKYCTVNHAPNRQYATTLIFLLIQNNLREMGHFSRMKLQSTVSVSKIVSENVKENEVKDFETLYACLDALTRFVKQYCNNNLLKNNNQSMFGSGNSGSGSNPSQQQQPIANQIEELRDRLFGVIRNSVKIQQHGYDPEMKADLYHQLSNTFIESPDLRITWLKSLAGFLQTTGNFEEAAQTFIITAALVDGYLKQLKRFHKNLQVDFGNVSPNVALDLKVLPDPSLLKAVEGEVCQMEDFTEKGFINLLKEAIKVLKRGSFFESCIETYQLLLPTYQKNREWKRQYECYSELVVLCNQMISESTVNQRLFANYYRVAFFGKNLLPEIHEKEYIYKELPSVRLADISERLQNQFRGKFGDDKFHLLPNKPVDRSTLNPDHIYLQIISVEPYLLPEELKERVSTFDQNTNLNKFIFEVPFTKSGKTHGDGITDQWKRKTILTTVSYFPYLKKRLLVCKKDDIELTPIEASIEIIQKKTQALRAELNSALPNTKTLQINLQGCLLLQVNAGPLAICNSFLDAEEFAKHNAEHITRLQESVKEFTFALGSSVKLNHNLTKNVDGGQELQIQLDKGYQNFREKVKQYVKKKKSMDKNNIVSPFIFFYVFRNKYLRQIIFNYIPLFILSPDNVYFINTSFESEKDVHVMVSKVKQYDLDRRLTTPAWDYNLFSCAFRLTPDSQDWNGVLWSRRPITLTRGFKACFTFQINVTKPTGTGDGLAFVIQNAPDKHKTFKKTEGSGMGYNMIPNSLAIEFDTCKLYDDPNNNHISIQTRDKEPNNFRHKYSIGHGSPTSKMDDGIPHDCVIEYDVSSQPSPFFSVSLDGQQVIKQVVYDLNRIGLDPKGRAYVGFTSATGRYTQYHRILHCTIFK